MRVLLSISICCAAMATDLAHVQVEPNLERRSHLALEHAEQSLKASRQAYNDGDLQRTAALLDEVGQSVDLAEKSLERTGKNPSKSPKHFKFAEITTGDLLRKIDAFSRDMNAADRPMTEKVKEKVQDAHDRLLHGIMTGKKK